MSEVRIDSGMETVTISVLRQLPRNSRIMAAGEQPRDQAFCHDAVDRGLDEHRLVEQLLHLDVGVGDAQRRQRVLDSLHHVEGGGVAGLEHRQQRPAAPVAADHVGLDAEAVAHVGHVAHVDGACRSLP